MYEIKRGRNCDTMVGPKITKQPALTSFAIPRDDAVNDIVFC